jgi:peptidoglycan/LPS O-acetylase OafA/YrhL
VSGTAYRADIDGLRAIAVLSVVFYHYGVSPLQGGFAGVDVFFVISGYLITGIIHREVVEGSFTFASFYERRIRRIFPALFAMLVAVFAAGLALLLPSDLTYLGKSIIATLLFSSNILFWRQSGYFDATSDLNPLLHTWSLAVEEQFYIGFPILLLLIRRYLALWIKSILVVCLIVSFVLCLYFQPLRPTATFYLLPFRAWELLLGGVLAIGLVPPITNERLNQVLAAAALSLLTASLWLMKASADFPGWQAALPAVATAGLLYCGTQGNTVVARLLSSRPLVVLGLSSYSLYLWHWPILVFARYREGMAPLSLYQTGFLLSATFFAAWVSYRWIEKPFRRKKPGVSSFGRSSPFPVAIAATTILASCALAVLVFQGAPGRVSHKVAQLDKARSNPYPNEHCNGQLSSDVLDRCRAGWRHAPSQNLMLWGDSHAMTWSPALDRIGRTSGVGVEFAFHTACPPLLGVRNPVSPYCFEFNARVLQKIKKERPDTIVMVASWPSYSMPEGQFVLSDEAGRKGNLAVFEPALRRTINAVRPFTGKIVLVGPTPGSPSSDPSFSLAMAEWHGDITPPAELSLESVRKRSSWFWRVAEHYREDRQVRLVDPSPWFCSLQKCAYRQGVSVLYRDGGHLSLAGADFVFRKFPAELLSGPQGR